MPEEVHRDRPGTDTSLGNFVRSKMSLVYKHLLV